MEEVCKTVNRIRNKAATEVKPFEMKEGTVLIRKVVRIAGTAVTVETQCNPGEPCNNFTAWIDYWNLGEPFNKLIKQGDRVDAKIKFISNRWEVLSFKVKEDPEDLKGDDEDFDFEQGDY